MAFTFVAMQAPPKFVKTHAPDHPDSVMPLLERDGNCIIIKYFVQACDVMS